MSFGSVKDLRQFEKIEKLGEGTYGKVYKVRHQSTGVHYALKKTLMDLDSEGIPAVTLREIVVLRDLSHLGIVKLVDVIISDQCAFLLFEYIDMDLSRYLKGFPSSMKLEITDVKNVMWQILVALFYCHSKRILHRDLKPHNILIDSNTMTIKIADFGLARAFQIPYRPYTTQIQTLWYRAPEILLGTDNYTLAIDMWSAGCIFAELITKEPLFPGQCAINQLYKIFQVLGTPNDDIWPGFTKLKNYNERFPKWVSVPFGSLFPTLDSQCLDLLEKMLALDPQKRISSREALLHVIVMQPFFSEFNTPEEF